MNRPRNVLLKGGDPRCDVRCEFQHVVGALRYSLTIHQTPAEETWPGGALWDCGVLLSQLVLAVAGIETLALHYTLLEDDEEETPAPAANKNKNVKKTKSASSTTSPNKIATHATNQMSSRFHQWIQSSSSHNKIWKEQIEPILLHSSGNLRIVEMGCGVGLTGLFASIALGASVCILTDLTEVVQQVTLPNVLENTTEQMGGGRKNSNKPSATNSSYSYRTIKHYKGGGKIIAIPFCWGNKMEGEQVLKCLQDLQSNSTSNNNKGGGKKGKTKHHNKNKTTTTTAQQHPPSSSSCYPDIILLGDVAYQHKPGAPSHFDILIESLLQLMPPQNQNNSTNRCGKDDDDQNTKTSKTLLLFGTRLRMPASMDLLLLLEENFTPLLAGKQSGIPAEILDPTLQGIKHNMTIHIFTNKQQ